VSTLSPPKLVDQVRTAIRLKHYSLRTEEAYWHWIRRFILFHNKRHPNEMAEAEISAFHNHKSKVVNAGAQGIPPDALLLN